MHASGVFVCTRASVMAEVLVAVLIQRQRCTHHGEQGSLSGIWGANDKESISCGGGLSPEKEGDDCWQIWSIDVDTWNVGHSGRTQDDESEHKRGRREQRGRQRRGGRARRRRFGERVHLAAAGRLLRSESTATAVSPASHMFGLVSLSVLSSFEPRKQSNKKRTFTFYFSLLQKSAAWS
jgi:hypothetical protein